MFQGGESPGGKPHGDLCVAIRGEDQGDKKHLGSEGKGATTPSAT